MKLVYMFCFWTFSVNHILWAATFSWDPSPSAEIQGYNFYQDGIKIGSTSALIFVVPNLIGGATHSFYVTAYVNGIESDPSNTLVYTPPIPSLKYLNKSIQINGQSNTDYTLEATMDLKTWFDVQRVNSSTATNTIQVEEFPGTRFFRLRQDIPTPVFVQARAILRAQSGIEPPIPQAPKKFWRRTPRYDKAGASMGLK